MRTLFWLLCTGLILAAGVDLPAADAAATRPGDAPVTLFTKFVKLNGTTSMVQLVARQEKAANKGEHPSFAVELLRTDMGNDRAVLLARGSATGVTGGEYVADAAVDESAARVYLVQASGRGFSIISVNTDAKDTTPSAGSRIAENQTGFPISGIAVAQEDDLLNIFATVRIAGKRQVCLRFAYSLKDQAWKHKDTPIVREEEILPLVDQRVK